MHIYLNGTVQPDTTPAISNSDRGFLLGDGLFETFKIINNKPLFLNEHIERLSHAANLLAIPLDISAKKVEEIISSLLEANSLKDQTVSARLTITRGAGPRGLLPPKEPSPTVVLTVAPYSAGPNKPTSLWITSTRRNEYSPLSNIKSLAYAENVFGRMEAAKNGADDALFLNTQGFVCETSMCNIFIIENGTLITPPLSEGVLPGIMRGKVIAIAKELGITCSEERISLDRCHQSDGMFVTNSLMDIKSVCTINNQPLKQHPSIPAVLSDEIVRLYRNETSQQAPSGSRLFK